MNIKKSFYVWAVVGAGPAGIAAVGSLLDDGIPPDDILWIDPHFKGGDLGLLWQNVSSNTKVQFFLDFLNDCHSFQEALNGEHYSLLNLDPEQTCLLAHIAQPLKKITRYFQKKVHCASTVVRQLSLSHRQWTLTTEQEIFQAKQVVLATGSTPANMDHPGQDILPFETAIDKHKLAAHVHKDHIYAVFGSSHSAMIIIRSLVELGVKKVINFYRSPCRYAIPMGDWILFDNTGLKGDTARWTREHIDGVLPGNLLRAPSSKANIDRLLPECNQVIYAVGFNPRRDLIIDAYEECRHNPHVGIIGPGLFGLGIGYPELKTDPFGTIESQVGLWKFMVYLKKVLPIWHKYSA